MNNPTILNKSELETMCNSEEQFNQVISELQWLNLNQDRVVVPVGFDSHTFSVEAKSPYTGQHQLVYLGNRAN